MTASFDERRKNFEEKWAHDADLRFKVHARRDRLLGEWAAEALGLNSAQTEAYVKAVVAAELSKGGENEVLKKLRHDFDAKRVGHSDHAIRQQMDALLKIAGEQVLSERGK